MSTHELILTVRIWSKKLLKNAKNRAVRPASTNIRPNNSFFHQNNVRIALQTYFLGYNEADLQFMDSLVYFNNPIFVKKSLKFSKNCDFRPVSTNHWYTDPIPPSRRQRIYNYIIFCVDGGRIATRLLKNNSQLPKTDNNIQVKQVRKCGKWLIITHPR